MARPVSRTHHLPPPSARPSKTATATAVAAAAATFVPCYLFTVIPAPYFKKYGKRPDVIAFVDGVTAAAIGSIAGAVTLALTALATGAARPVVIGTAIVATLVLLRHRTNVLEMFRRARGRAEEKGDL